MVQTPSNLSFSAVSNHSVTRWAFALVAFAMSAWALVSHWADVVEGLTRIGLGRTLLSAPLMLLGLGFGMLAWRTLLRSMGTHLPLSDAGSMYFFGQIGKYVPGSLWPVAAQMEIGKHYGIPRGRSATSILLALCVSLTTGVGVVLCVIPLLDPRTAKESAWFLVVLPLLLAVLYPKLLWRLLRKVPRLGPSLELGPVPRLRDIVEACLFSLAGWLAYGFHLWVLVTSFGPQYLGWKNIAISAAAYAFAWVAGLLFFVLPAGAGARDLSLVVAMSAILPSENGLAVAVLSRGISIACDLAAAGVGGLHLKQLRAKWTADGSVVSPETSSSTSLP